MDMPFKKGANIKEPREATDSQRCPNCGAEMRLAEVATGLVQYICPACGKYEVDPETGQISPTHEESLRWLIWINEHEPEFEEKYAGRYLAIWDEQIVGRGDDWGQAYDAAKRWRKDIVPYIIYIPTEKEEFLLV
jgi:predicted RNA-binding Zn-ribbon protein involved in translation (DUF1610 family)